ncbi:uncharacterized protein EKO05_0006599 [Ascochyta rabiei]|uniref:uncharacterized protein n=1 Tax=Didymella rabiei TaxID=5454 RepID=UPI002208AB9D|nr:uncharacterized protein EKO05_0006599 [Ascochyta rabiei]UPX16183.1 hypothetical protein EKO05_0006599 [Ascochyta rabiei]
MPRRVSFGATPAPYRSPDPCTRSGSSLKTAELQRTQYGHAATTSVTDSTLERKRRRG